MHIEDTALKQLRKDKFICFKLLRALNKNSKPKKIERLKVKYLQLSTKYPEQVNKQDTPANSTTRNRKIQEIVDMRNHINRKQNTLFKTLRGEKIKSHINRLLELYSNEPKKFFSKIMKKFQNHKSMNVLRDPNNPNKSSSNTKTKLDYTLNFWSNIYKHKTKRGKEVPWWLANKCEFHTQDKVTEEITMTELKQTIQNMQNFRAPGVDKIPAELYKTLTEKALEILLRGYNSVIKNDAIPSEWKTARIKLIYKSGDESDLGNFRPISLIDVQYKIFSNIIRNRLSNFLESNGLFTDLQNGFRKGRGTSNNINTLINVLEDANDQTNDNLAHLVYIDLRKAFDSIEHWVIKDTLTHFGVQESSVRLIMSMYQDLEAFVDTPFGNTKTFKVERGGETRRWSLPFTVHHYPQPHPAYPQKHEFGFQIQ